METLGVNVRDVRKTAAFFADLFDLNFGEFDFGGNAQARTSHQAEHDPSRLGAQAFRVAMDHGGFFEFLETAQSKEGEGFRNIHFKVADMNVAKREMEKRGIKLLAEHHIGGVWETVYNPAELFGIRLCFVQYNGPSMIHAVLNGGETN